MLLVHRSVQSIQAGHCVVIIYLDLFVDRKCRTRHGTERRRRDIPSLVFLARKYFLGDLRVRVYLRILACRIFTFIRDSLGRFVHSSVVVSCFAGARELNFLDVV